MRYSNVPTETELLNRVQSRLDNFATFSWRGKQSWTNYHMFIISKVGDLKFYNGPTFSNEYTKPQYQSASGNLTGITFNTQQISFKVGMYYFDIDLYREALEWLNPYEINYLGFSFSPVYNYLVKLSKIGDSPRNVIATVANSDEEHKYRYYTELTLTFDILGPNCVRGVTPYEFYQVTSLTDGTIKLTPKSSSLASMNGYYTDLDSPMVFDIQLVLSKDSTVSEENESKAKLTLTAYEKIDDDEDNDIPTQLFCVQFQNLTTAILPSTATYTTSIYVLNITYDSETGLLFETYGDDSRKLLSLLSTTSEGKSLVKSMSSNTFALPGKIGQGWTNTTERLSSRWYFVLKVEDGMNLDSYSTSIVNPEDTTATAVTTSHDSAMQLTCYTRTNVI